MRLIDPDPRVGDRQVTCGAPECQRRRHARQCKDWHAGHREAADNHYRDVVVPFRRRHPRYQRNWRLASRLRETREESRRLVEQLARGVCGAVAWGQSVRAGAADERAQPRSIIGKRLDVALASAAQLGGVLKQLRALTMQLDVLGA